MNEHYMFHMCSATINFPSTAVRLSREYEPVARDSVSGPVQARYSGSLRIVQGEPGAAAGANGARITSAWANDRLAKSELSW
jgi:hypothetical protein